MKEAERGRILSTMCVCIGGAFGHGGRELGGGNWPGMRGSQKSTSRQEGHRISDPENRWPSRRTGANDDRTGIERLI